jgi:hypothetical protein
MYLAELNKYPKLASFIAGTDAVSIFFRKDLQKH